MTGEETPSGGPVEIPLEVFYRDLLDEMVRRELEAHPFDVEEALARFHRRLDGELEPEPATLLVGVCCSDPVCATCGGHDPLDGRHPRCHCGLSWVSDPR